jgi:peptide/nickel transport system substrate-binding protein
MSAPHIYSRVLGVIGGYMKRMFLHSLVATSMAAAIALGAAAVSNASTATTHVKTGGTLQVDAVASQWPGLDSASDTQDTADAAYLNAIYGQLFELTPSNKIIPDEATKWQLTNKNSTLVFTIRNGLTFSNGDPFTAADVAWSINRDLEPQWGNIGDSNFPFASAGCSASGSTVTCPMTEPDVAIVPAFINEAPNWTVDETALNSMGETSYEQNPVGAGPFKVTLNEASAQLNLVKNSKYWEKGHPYLAGIDFTSVGTDQSAADALQSGQAQLAMGMSTIPLFKSLAKDSSLKVTKLPAMVTEFINLNTISGPFTNITAREAVQYATNSKELVKELYGNEYTTVQSQTAPGQDFYTTTNKYFRPYNLAKARKLVKEIPGGLTVDLSTTTNTAFFINEVQAIATMWEAAGINVNIQDYSLQQMLQITFGGSWQSIDENWGVGVDPGINDSEFFSENAAFTGNKDASLQGLLNQGPANANPIARQRVYTEIGNLENQKAYAVFMYAKNAFFVQTTSLNSTGDFTSNQFAILWENMSL